LDWPLEKSTVSSSRRIEVITKELPGAGEPSRSCAALSQPAPDTTENARAIGIHVTFGQFRLVDLSDLTADKEFDLMCPNNLLGTVDLFMVSHHGQPSSNSRLLVHGLRSRAAIMNNGIRKGGQPAVMEALYSAPGLEDLWQLQRPERLLEELSGRAGSPRERLDSQTRITGATLSGRSWGFP
jgi:competence protein ComEC